MNAAVTTERKTIGHWIGGEAVRGTSGRSGPVYNPATGEQTGEVDFATVEEIDRAVATAKAAAAEWRTWSLSKRADLFFRIYELVDEHRDDLARLLTAEHGKVLSDAHGEVQRGIEVIEYVCGIPTLLKGGFSEQAATGIDVYSIRQPLGVVAGITPFNFPVMVPMWMWAPAIACGNAFILKPSEKDPSASLLTAELLKEAGLPDGVFNVIQGDKVAVDRLLEHPDIAAISFVGSTPIARYVYENGTKNGKRVQALGGRQEPHGRPPRRRHRHGRGRRRQRRLRLRRRAVHGDLGGRRRRRRRRRARRRDQGAAAERQGRRRHGSVLRDGPARHARAPRQGGVLPRLRARPGRDARRRRSRDLRRDGDGFFLGASLLDNVTPEMDAYRDEIFGPVLSVVRVDSYDEALRLVNDNPYGNGVAIFTRDGGVARQFQFEVNVGMVGVNVPIPVPVAYYSFGGWKNSLFGDRHIYGPEGIDFYTRTKAVTSRWPDPKTSKVDLGFPQTR